jgi:putative endonuclease
MQHFVYILQSETDGTYYKGYSTDYKRRLEEHNLGLSQYTSTKRPWKLVYVEVCADKTSALKREKQLKRANSDYLLWVINQPINILKGSSPLA